MIYERKKGQVSIDTLIVLAIVMVIIFFVASFLYKVGIVDRLKNVLPDFDKGKQGFGAGEKKVSVDSAEIYLNRLQEFLSKDNACEAKKFYEEFLDLHIIGIEEPNNFAGKIKNKKGYITEKNAELGVWLDKYFNINEGSFGKVEISFRNENDRKICAGGSQFALLAKQSEAKKSEPIILTFDFAIGNNPAGTPEEQDIVHILWDLDNKGIISLDARGVAHTGKSYEKSYGLNAGISKETEDELLENYISRETLNGLKLIVNSRVNLYSLIIAVMEAANGQETRINGEYGRVWTFEKIFSMMYPEDSGIKNIEPVLSEKPVKTLEARRLEIEGQINNLNGKFTPPAEYFSFDNPINFIIEENKFYISSDGWLGMDKTLIVNEENFEAKGWLWNSANLAEARSRFKLFKRLVSEIESIRNEINNRNSD